MTPRPLPPDALRLLTLASAPALLIRHLALVHDVACDLLDGLAAHGLLPATVDADAVRMGAALHDIGKTLHPAELTHPGALHEAAGESLLQELQLPPHLARFARTHAAPLDLEDLLVAWADKLWRGKRDAALEDTLLTALSTALATPAWQLWLDLDDLATTTALSADARLAYQG
jgi:hypothetical protein